MFFIKKECIIYMNKRYNEYEKRLQQVEQSGFLNGTGLHKHLRTGQVLLRQNDKETGTGLGERNNLVLLQQMHPQTDGGASVNAER